MITTRYTIVDLAKMIGASRETVGKVLTELTREHFIEQNDNKLFLLKDFPYDW